MLLNIVRSLCFVPLSGFLLAACTLSSKVTSSGVIPDASMWLQHKQKVQKLICYQTRGTFAYLSDKKKLSANFFWQEFPFQRYRFMLINLFGRTEFALYAQSELIQITNGQGQRYTGKDAEHMLSEFIGMRIPLTNLRQWMIGLPGKAQKFTIDEQANLKTAVVQQNGLIWKVKYFGYDNTITPNMPNVLELTQAEQRIKIKMNHWTLQ